MACVFPFQSVLQSTSNIKLIRSRTIIALILACCQNFRASLLLRFEPPKSQFSFLFLLPIPISSNSIAFYAASSSGRFSICSSQSASSCNCISNLRYFLRSFYSSSNSFSFDLSYASWTKRCYQVIFTLQFWFFVFGAFFYIKLDSLEIVISTFDFFRNSLQRFLSVNGCTLKCFNKIKNYARVEYVERLLNLLKP